MRNGKELSELSLLQFTADEADRRDEIEADVRLADSIKSLLSDSGMEPAVIIKALIKDVLHLDSLYNTLEKGGGLDDSGKGNIS